MVDYLFLALILVELAIIVVQAYERFAYAEQMAAQHQKLIAAILTKNPAEYREMIKADKEPTAEKAETTDDIEISNASDEEFNKHIFAQTQ
jgi:hypothetical protein